MNKNFETQKAPKAFRTISEVAGELDLKPYVIRFWESQFKQIKPMRRKGGRRYYRPRDIDFLRGLKDLLHEKNHTIKKVKDTIAQKGKEFVISQPSKRMIERSTSKKQNIKIKFSHSNHKILEIKKLDSEEKKQQINSLLKSFCKLRDQMLARANL
ncbi:MAG: MerR family transcriptional regulator [Alphaproteobacteria bacterium]|nr:MAG: MerR family transcriptional regulator [Alphaproteobacteria bacterium]